MWTTDATGILTGTVAGWALENATDAIIVIDEQGIVQAWNQACVDLFGWPKSEAVGRDVDFMIPPKLRPGHHRGFSSAMAAGEMASDGSARRTKSLRADGTSVYIEMTFGLVRDAEGTAIGAVAVARPST